MTLATFLAFLAASGILLLIPGPTVLLVVSYALGQGLRTALPIAIGVALGDFTAMTLSMLGLGALLAASGTVFTLLKWLGAAYLIWLGVKLWRAGGTLDAAPRTRRHAAAADARARFSRHGAQSEKPHLLHRLPAAVPRPQRGFPDADAHPRGKLPRPRLGKCFGYALVASRARALMRNPRAVRSRTAWAAAC